MRELLEKSAASFIVTHGCLASTTLDVVFIVWHRKYGQLKAAMRVFAAPFYDTVCKEVFQVDIDRNTGTKESSWFQRCHHPIRMKRTCIMGVMDEIASLHGRGSCRGTHAWLDVDHFHG